jgi:hypothetical protein
MTLLYSDKLHTHYWYDFMGSRQAVEKSILICMMQQQFYF